MKYHEKFPGWEADPEMEDSGRIYPCGAYKDDSIEGCGNRTGLRLKSEEHPGVPVCSQECKDILKRPLITDEMIEALRSEGEELRRELERRITPMKVMNVY